MGIGIKNSNYCSFSEEYSDFNLVLGANIAIKNIHSLQKSQVCGSTKFVFYQKSFSVEMKLGLSPLYNLSSSALY